MTKCEPGCTCKRHQRKPATDEQRARMREAQRNAKGKKCEPGCTCNRHKAYYRGGSKKGRPISDEGRQKMAEGARNRFRDNPEARQRLGDQLFVQRQNPEFEAKRVAALQERLTGSSCPEGCTCAKHSQYVRTRLSEYHTGSTHSEETKRKIGDASRASWAKKTPEEVAAIMAKRSAKLKGGWAKEKASGNVRQTGGYLHSKHELALVPYMAALGYAHNADGKTWVGRRVPDFFDHASKRVYEYFGTYWHPRPEEEAEAVDYYQLLGWKCTVLWESDLYSFLAAHRELVTEQEHELAWLAARVNNGYRKPSYSKA